MVGEEKERTSFDVKTTNFAARIKVWHKKQKNSHTFTHILTEKIEYL